MMEWSNVSNMMESPIPIEGQRHKSNPTPTLTALLMDYDQIKCDDVHLQLMEIEEDHDITNNNNQHINPRSASSSQTPATSPSHIHPTSPPSQSCTQCPQPLLSTQQADRHSMSGTHERVPHVNNLAQSPKKCCCPCIEGVLLIHDTNGRTDHLLAEWLTKCVHMVRNYPVLGNIEFEDIRTLMFSAWKELVILYMAQHNFQFEVFTTKANLNASCCQKERKRSRKTIAMAKMLVPSSRHVDQLKFIIGKLEHMKLDSKEFALLRLLMLLNTDLRHLKNSNVVEKASEQIHTLLMEYEAVCYPNEPLRLSHMLLHLPGVRGFPVMVFEQLFYRHLVCETSIKSVLKELLEC